MSATSRSVNTGPKSTDADNVHFPIINWNDCRDVVQGCKGEEAIHGNLSLGILGIFKSQLQSVCLNKHIFN